MPVSRRHWRQTAISSPHAAFRCRFRHAAPDAVHAIYAAAGDAMNLQTPGSDAQRTNATAHARFPAAHTEYRVEPVAQACRRRQVPRTPLMPLQYSGCIARRIMPQQVLQIARFTSPIENTAAGRMEEVAAPPRPSSHVGSIAASSSTRHRRSPVNLPRMTDQQKNHTANWHAG